MRHYAFILLLLLCSPVSAQFSIGTLLGSNHPGDDGFECFGVARDYNETQMGVFVQYRGWLVGRYENSYSGCDGLEYSNLIGYESTIGRLGSVEFSATAALVDGYPVDPEFGEYRAWATINARWKIFKVYYGYKVVGYGLEWRW